MSCGKARLFYGIHNACQNVHGMILNINSKTCIVQVVNQGQFGIIQFLLRMILDIDLLIQNSLSKVITYLYDGPVNFFIVWK